MAATATTLDAETRATHADHDALRLWLRLLTCTTLIEQRVRTKLRDRFAISLPRFDLMAQLERNPQGLRMGELSRRLMVTGGNVTGITDQLVAEGLVERRPITGDRRAFAVRLTPRGKRAFDAMAAAHEAWVIEMFAAMPRTERARLYALLGRVKAAVSASEGEAGTPTEDAA